MIKIRESGQALIETLIALSMAAVAVSVVAILVINALNDSSYAKAQTLASDYATEGIEYARKLRDQDYTGFKNYSGKYCLADQGANPFSGPVASCSNNVGGGTFSRELNFSSAASCGTAGNEGIFVNSIVSWSDGKCTQGDNCHNISLYSCLSTNTSYQ